MAQIRFANNVSTQLTKSVAADDSTIEVRSLTQGLVWPNISATGDYFLVVIEDISTASWEIMKCTNVQINGNETVLTVERGLEGTTATALQAGSVVENRLTAGTLDGFSAGFPTKVEINRGGTGATTAEDARTNLGVPSKTEFTSEVARLDQKITDNIPPAATTSVRGITILSNAVDSVSEDLAATPKAVKTAYDKAVAVDTRLTSEVNTLEAADTATNQKLTSEVSRLEGEIAAHTPPDASLTTKGIVQLSSAIDSTSETLAATSKAVKTAYDKAVAAANAANAAASKSASADKLTTARSITLTGPVTGTVNFDGSANVSIPTTVVSATTSAKGIVQLSSATNSASETTAATSKAIKALADSLNVVANVPIGGIIAFSGTFGGTNNRYPIPLGSTAADTNWCLCDGVETNSKAVPDLRGRMIIGVSSTYTLGGTGGAATHHHTLSGSVSPTTLTVAQLASHTHIFGKGTYGTSAEATGNESSNQSTHATGGSQPHTHALAGTTASANNLPPYYALAFIMRVA